jgi:uncharacterized protein YpmB
MRQFREWLLIAAYIILVLIVAYESFFINNQFDDSHTDQCRIAEVQAQLAVVNMALIAEPDQKEQMVKVVNGAIRALNDTCDTNVPEIQSGGR